jgi:hypothetical protein
MWVDFRDAILSGHQIVIDMDEGKLFSATSYKPVESLNADPEFTVYDKVRETRFTRRTKENVVAVHMLVLDFDGAMTIQDAKERFERFEYVAYTSFNHLTTPEVERFRIVMPLATPIPAGGAFTDCSDLVRGEAWYEVQESLRGFVGPCDPASLRCSQFFRLPIITKDRAALASCWSNSGEVVDWTKWNRKKPTDTYSIGSFSASEDRRSEKKLDPNQVLRTQRGPLRVQDVFGKVEGVWCPFHKDKNGSEFVKRVQKTNDVFLYCRRCDKTFFMLRPDEVKIETTPLEEAVTFELRQRTDSFLDPADRHIVDEQLLEIRKDISKERKDKRDWPRQPSHVIYMAEGTGKSRLAIELAESGHQIIFACKSLDQVFSKYEEFSDTAKKISAARKEADELVGLRELGVSARRISPIQVTRLLSKGAKGRLRFGVDVVRQPQNLPYRLGKIEDERTLVAFRAANKNLSEEFIRVSWRFFGPDRMYFQEEPFPITNEAGELEDWRIDWDKYRTSNIVVTTFAQIRLLKALNQVPPKNWIIWFDDPDTDDLLDIEPYDPSRHGELTEEIEREKEIVRGASGQKYFQREETQSLGSAVVEHRCVFTTTERVVLQLLEITSRNAKKPLIKHDYMAGVSGGNISILGTENVYARYDAIIPLLVRRLEKQGFNIRLIADGLAQPLNHSNTKGRNSLKKQDLVVEISAAHPSKVMTICDAIGISFKQGRPIIVDLMIDQLHQALGRSQGYRYEGAECVVLVPPNMHSVLLAHARYKYDEQNSVLIDRTADMGRRDSRLSKDSASPLVRATEQFLNNFDLYVQDKRLVIPDVRYVLEHARSDREREAYASRLLHALTTLSGVQRFDQPPTAEDIGQPLYQSYRDVVDAVLETFPAQEDVDRVWKLYRQRLEPPKAAQIEDDSGFEGGNIS